jgi:hypothetical protein
LMDENDHPSFFEDGTTQLIGARRLPVGLPLLTATALIPC